MDTINIRIVKLRTLRNLLDLLLVVMVGRGLLLPITNNSGDTTGTYPVYVRVLEAPAPDHLVNEAFRLAIAHPMDEMLGRALSPLTEAGGLVVGAVLAHVMDESTVEMPTHLIHFLDYFHFLKFFQFLYLLLHYLPYWLRVFHLHIVVPPEKRLQPGHIQQARNLIVMGENGLRTIMVLNKTSTVLIHSTDGS